MSDQTGKIIVGVDGTPGSLAALRWAARYAEDSGSTIRAITVWNFSTTLGWVLPPTAEGLPERHASKVLQTTLDDVFGSHRPPTLESLVVEGQPASELVRAADHANLLVLGTRDLGGFAATLLGSVSTRCLQHATCPVVVVRP